jgi:hypothetical protein
MSYIIKEYRDSYGGDCAHYPNKSVEELKILMEKHYDAVGFNTAGYIKNHLQLASDENMPNFQGNLYINQEKIDTEIDRKKRIITGNCKGDITFVITSCKRLNYFIKTINNFLYHCQDLYVFNKWVCIDDNSSEEDRTIMKSKYKFFEFIFKDPSQKGHAKSLNIMLKKIKTKYVYLLEDDWECRQPFSILPYIDFMSAKEFDQLSFMGRGKEGLKYPQINAIGNIPIYKYVYNQYSQIRKELSSDMQAKYTLYEKEFNLISEEKEQDHGHCYPGFSLNPSIFDIAKLKNYNLSFRENEEFNDTFELYFAFKCRKIGYKIAFTDISFIHIGEISAYVLNDKSRTFDNINK